MKGKIFNNQEAQAILSKQKTMFREVIKPQPNSNINPVKLDYLYRTWQWATKESRRESPYQVGQKIFVKESFSRLLINEGHKYYYPAHLLRECVDKDNGFHYWADGNPEFGDWESPKPSTHMKQHQSRITLRIKDISVERLQDISEEDCWKEGLEEFADYQDQLKICEMAKQLGECIEDPRPHFATWWNATRKKPEEKFEANPWVWKIEFEVVK